MMATESRLQTMAEYRRNTRDFAYFGEREDWLIVYTTHRDSDILELANFEALRRLIPEDEYAIETFSHWLVGHGSWLLMAPDSTARERIEQKLKDLDDYPIVNEELMSEMEFEFCLDVAEQALRFDLHVPESEAKDAASFVFSWSEDAGGEFCTGWSGADHWWPKPKALFFGYLTYRRWKRQGN